MGDFIKDLNIIDFLGMLLPGSLFIMAEQKVLPIDELLKYFGENPGTAPRVTILLVAGYVIGMLFHELGDSIEWLLWKCQYLDPRTCAAKKAGLIDYLAVGDVTKLQALQKIRSGDRIYFSAIDGKTDMRKRNLFEGFRTMARNLLIVLILLSPSVWCQANTTQKNFFIAACVFLFLRYIHYSHLKFKYIYEDYISANNKVD